MYGSLENLSISYATIDTDAALHAIRMYCMTRVYIPSMISNHTQLPFTGRV